LTNKQTKHLSRWKQFIAVVGLAIPAITNAFAEAADVPEESRFSLNGFGTAALTHSSSKEAGFVRDLSQPHGSQGGWSGNVDSLLGIQASWRTSDNLALVSQVVSRYHYDSSYDPELMWAFARYDLNGYSTFRLGRLGTDFYLFADSRQVGYTYLTVRPSTDYFGALPFSHLDGADAQFTMSLGSALLRARVHMGWLDEKLALAERTWSLRGSRMTGGSLSLQQGPWTIRLSSSELKFRHNLPIDDLSAGLRLVGAITAANALDVAGSTSRFDALGSVYEEGPLQIQFMLSRASHSSQAFQNWQAGYLLAGYRHGKLTPFASYSWIRSKARTLSTGMPDGLGAPLDQLNSGTASVLADSHSDQRTSSLGVRWDFQENMDMKIQFDAIRGRASSIFPFRDETSNWNGRTNVLTLALDFIF
jgi:hypothetical protein